MSSAGAPRAAVPVSNARAEASRRNGAKSRGPKTEKGKARSAQNALKHGLRAQKYLVLPEEDAAEFAGLEAALIEELAPVGVLQAVLARRVAVAAWRLARADRIEAELFEERRFADGGLGLALIRDGNGTRSFETLLRYRGAAMAEFWRALRTLKALQAEAAVPVEQAAGALALEERGRGALARVPVSTRPSPDERGPSEPEPSAARCEATGSVTANESAPARTLHEPPARWTPKEPEPQRTLHEPAAPWQPNESMAGADANKPENRSSPGEITTSLALNQARPQRQESDTDGRRSTHGAQVLG